MFMVYLFVFYNNRSQFKKYFQYNTKKVKIDNQIKLINLKIVITLNIPT